MISVLIADDHGVIRDGLGRLIDALDDIELAGTANDGAEAVERSRELTPDVVLMDLDMPTMDGIEATRRIVEERPGTAVLVLTSFSDRARILGALSAGACGYLLKDAHPDELLRGVRAAAVGEAPFSPRAAKALLTLGGSRHVITDLSDREREVLSCVVEGLPNKLIARRLAISEKTVKAHLTSVFRRIGVTDRTQAALWAERHGVTPSS